MGLLKQLTTIWQGVDHPLLIHNETELKFSHLTQERAIDLTKVRRGDVVALIGDFDPQSITTLLRLIDMGVVVVPLSYETKHEHDYFFDTAFVDVIIDHDRVQRRSHDNTHDLIRWLRTAKKSGLVLFSTGTSGRPKAILHDFTQFLKRFDTPRPALRTMSFLLFDHIGGLNTLFHTLFNKGVVVTPEERNVGSILDVCERYKVELLPTTPTFLRTMLLSGAVPNKLPSSLKVISYGTEQMDQSTLCELCRLCPDIDFRQTYGMSELGIVRVKSKSRNSLFIKIGGEGIETRVVNKVLQIRSQSRMVGYLNTDSPFDKEGWYDTKDMVEEEGEYFKILGRVDDVITVGGLKFMSSEVERTILQARNVFLAKVYSRKNPVTGQHVELLVQPTPGKQLDKTELMSFLKKRLQPHMVPKRIKIGEVSVGHRFKRA